MNILVVLVLFRRAAEDTPSWRFLRATLDSQPKKDCPFNITGILVFDNSPTRPLSKPGDDDLTYFENNIYYIHDPANGGTRAAYQQAASMARESGADWVLLLDHDTALPEDFFRKAFDALGVDPTGGSPVAVLPWITDAGVIISPSLLHRSGRCRPLDPAIRLGSFGAHWRLTGIASGCLMRREALDDLQTIPEVFRLDYLDHWLFRSVQSRGGKIIISEARLEHSLSVNDHSGLSPSRYRNILAAESHYLHGLSEFRGDVYLLHHVFRTVRLILVGAPLKLVVVALKHMFEMVGK